VALAANSHHRDTDGYRDISYGELGTRVALLAHGLRQLGVSDGDRVATFMWNNQEHLEAYFAAPCMGAVLHTLNIRLAGEQIALIANQADDRVVLVDMSLVPLLTAVLPEMTSVQTVVAVRRRPTVAAAVPTIWNDVLQFLHANPGRDISSLRLVACGGSAVPAGDHRFLLSERRSVEVR
jgi:acyl-CoA synthetase (AMP-forming)/AMP-acid ligase II